MTTRTLEQKLKFDSGLPIGRSLVKLTRGPSELLALVDISPRGIVRVLRAPEAGTVYSCWRRIRGDDTEVDGAVIVWGARDPAMLQEFKGAPRAVVEVTK